MKRRLVYTLHFAIIIAALFAWHAANASPTPVQVRAAVDPAFSVRRVSLGVLTLAAAADVLTTEQGLHRGCVEANGLYGSHPSLPLMIGTHGLIIATAYRWHSPAWANYTAAVLFVAASVHNATLHCRP